MYQYEYAREALKNGLELEAKHGTNPYKFGMVGSSDAHTALAAMEEENYFGKHSGTEPSPGRIDHPMAEFAGRRYEGWAMSASGYAAVWATENTREALWDAMMRKEVYATTGPRILVRFFGGWDFNEGRCVQPPAGRGRVQQGRAHGRRPLGGSRGQVSDLPRCGDERSLQREPRSHPGRQGLAR